MMSSTSTTALEARVAQRYAESGYELGWRLLYSPAKVLARARVAFIGLNPGGGCHAEGHAEFAMPRGSAYALENWGAPPGESRLQRQVLALFDLIGEKPDEVLAGNLVPFRSPNWKALVDKRAALAFGTELWREVLANADPRLVITMGGVVSAALCRILQVRTMQRIPLGWGKITGSRGEFANGTLVRVPHLSRFTVVTRPESQSGLQELLRPHYRGL